VGADCATNDDCEGDLECNTSLGHGYCGASECETNDDCTEPNTVCVDRAEGPNLCLKRCTVPSDCSSCRADATDTACSDEVVFTDDGETGSVCVPN
jgi:hypothetical protein